MILLPNNAFVLLNTNLRFKNIFKEISALSIIRIKKYINDFFNFITYKIKKLLTILKRRSIIIYVNKTCLKNMFKIIELRRKKNEKIFYITRLYWLTLYLYL